MFTINTLRESRAKAWEACKNFLDSHRTENGTLTAEDNATYEKMEAEVMALGREIERMERNAALDKELSLPVGAPDQPARRGWQREDRTGQRRL